MSRYEFFSVDESGGVKTVKMNRPPLNVLNIPMMEEFNELLESTLGSDDLAAVVIAANGKAFSAGVDVADHAADKVAEMVRSFHGIFRKLAATDVLSVAAVNGPALGGGCELACFCDIVLASEHAKFGQPEVQVGVFPPVAACVFPHQTGLKQALELNVRGQPVSAVEAHRIGLVNHVYAAEVFESRVQAYLDGIRRLSRPVLRMAKRATVLRSREQVLADLDRTERLYLDELMKLSDAHEGIEAFLGKRAPVWCHA